MLRTIAIAAVLALVFIAIGAYAIYTSEYSDVSTLQSVTRASRVTVQAGVAYLGYGTATVIYGGKTYTLEARGAYGILMPTDGSGSSYAFFVMEGEKGYKVAALYELDSFTARYGGSPVFEDTVVVDGVYRPGEELVLLTPAGEESLPVVTVNAILKGCHAAYDSEKAVVEQ
ncbi:hypothetical protein APE_0052.1 [Aeropyrum pernix K1]|uniref:Uncharacterized protein n=1 Tax=Aeropyrum pernix (strain ATCC 700893 / DSM 11879 / JCM 9820 / NBRC 100138 / K1) TaxID=272557 RepID=Q9YG49_AERPE|nr:hypothetical protein [Aeropyrum pernix]BAA78961.2 hypothetical protein APE_0052.1 [Aeropyrum pernix K1]